MGENKKKIEAIATDPPYGQASSLRKKTMEQLLRKFLKNAHKNLRDGGYLVIILPKRMKIKSKLEG